MLFFENISRCTIANSLMRTKEVIFHFPQFKLILAILRINEAYLMKKVFIVSAIRAFNKPIFPRFTLGNKGVNTPGGFYSLSKGCFVVRTISVFHCKVHSVVSKGYEKGGR